MGCIKSRDEAKYLSLFQEPVLWTGIYKDRTQTKRLEKIQKQSTTLQTIIKLLSKVLKMINLKKNLTILRSWKMEQ